SADLSRYQELAADNLRYDKHAKAYVPAGDFAPIFLKQAGRQYLANLRSLADEVIPPQDTWFGWLPPFAVAPLLRRRAYDATLRAVLQGIHRSMAIQVYYQSMT